jgi:hypothetical protein
VSSVLGFFCSDKILFLFGNSLLTQVGEHWIGVVGGFGSASLNYSAWPSNFSFFVLCVKLYHAGHTGIADGSVISVDD